MIPTPSRVCPACGSQNSKQVWIIDKNPQHQYLEYVAHDSERSGWTGNFPIKGRVASIMCGGCGLILLYGINYRDPEEVKALQEAARGRISIAGEGKAGALSDPSDSSDPE